MNRIPKTLLLLAVLALAALLLTGAKASAGWRLLPRLQGLGIDLHKGEAKHPKVSAEQQCSHCHQARHRSPLAGPCSDCHTTASWASAKHRHKVKSMDAYTHRTLRCVLCHTDPNRMPRSTCGSCHQTKAHRWEPLCKQCHVVQSWSKTSLKKSKDHPRVAARHANLRCPDCHAIIQGKPFLPRCKECHKSHKKEQVVELGTHAAQPCVKCHNITPSRDNLNKLAIKVEQCAKCHKPRHGKGYDACLKCHTEKFKGTSYDHSKNWPLTGKHLRLACAKCHADLQWGRYKGTRCLACHTQKHTALTDCAKCHTTSGFKPSTFRHDSVYRLKGAHQRVACARCHPNSDWGVVRGKTCVQCHKVKHGGLTDCAKCHTNEAFKPSKFRHDSVWEKTGVHATTACTSCHPKKEYAWVRGTTCVQCHGVKHGGQLKCSSCHRTFGWTPIKDVEHTPKYPLIGQHKYVDCIACHKNLRFRNTPNRCYDCHADVAHGMPGHKQCEKCHTPRSWKRILPHDMSACQ